MKVRYIETTTKRRLRVTEEAWRRTFRVADLRPALMEATIPGNGATVYVPLHAITLAEPWEEEA